MMSYPYCRRKHKIYDEKIEKIYDIRKLIVGFDSELKEMELNYDNNIIKIYKLSLGDDFKKFVKFYNNKNSIQDEIYNLIY